MRKDPEQEQAAADSTKRFAADGLLLIGANGLAGLLFLLVHAVLGRAMDGADYAAVVALLGLLNVLSVGANTAQVTLARFTSGEAAAASWGHLARRALRRAALWAWPALGLWCLLAFALRPVLDAPSVLALWILGLVAVLQLFVPLVQGVLQGRRWFGWLAAAAVAGAGGRLVSARVLASPGALDAPDGGATRVLWAFVIGALVSLGVCLWPARHRLLASARPRGIPLEHPDSGPIYRYGFAVAVGQVALFTLMNADLVLAPRLLDDGALADFGKAAMLARTVIFLPLPVVLAMFPRAVVTDRRSVLGLPTLFVLLAASGSALLLGLRPDWPLGLMYGPEAVTAPAMGLVRLYVWAAIPLALVEVLVPYLWARDRLGTVMLALIPASLYVAFLLRLGGEPQGRALEGLVLAFGIASLVTLLGLVVALARPASPIPADAGPGTGVLSHLPTNGGPEADAGSAPIDGME